SASTTLTPSAAVMPCSRWSLTSGCLEPGSAGNLLCPQEEEPDAGEAQVDHGGHYEAGHRRCHREGVPERQHKDEVVDGVHDHDRPDGVHAQTYGAEEDANESRFEDLVGDAELIRAREKEVVQVAQPEEGCGDRHARAAAKPGQRLEDDTAVGDLFHEDVDQDEAHLEGEHE